MKAIKAWGVRQNNLKNIDVEIPLGSFTVVCGPSGSGKSSLAFQTLYAEGQRRYIESLSSYSRQFLNKAPKPDLDGIENIPPALSIEQKNSVKTSRSTVGTTTELIDFLRLLYEKLGEVKCPTHHISLHADSPSSGADRVLASFPDQRGYVLAPVPSKGRLMKGPKLLEFLKTEGFRRIYVPSSSKLKWIKGTHLTEAELGEIKDLEDPKNKTAPTKEFYVVIDRLQFSKEERGRLADSLSLAFATSLKLSKETIYPEARVVTTTGQQLLLSEDNSCSVCGFRFPQLSTALFSFNSPVGACPECNGFGNKLELDPNKVIPNPKLSLNQGALSPFAMPSAQYDRRELRAYCKKKKIDMDVPWEKLSKKHQKAIWDGTKEFYGVKGLFEYLEEKKYKMHVRVFLARFKSPFTCPTCHGTRLKPEALQVKIQGKSIGDLSAYTLKELAAFMETLKLTPSQEHIVKEPFRQIRSRLKYLMDVGVGYLSVDRPTRTLSGGEYQRLQLAHQLGMGLSQTLFVLDEPTVGLHPRDTHRLVGVLKDLKSLGNTLVVVEHDHDVILNANYVLEIGPGSGHLGGKLVFKGDAKSFLEDSHSLTAGYLNGSMNRVPSRPHRPVQLQNLKHFISFENCTGHNLKNVSVKIPLNRLVTVTGVSGSGKSTLVSSTIYPAVARRLGKEFLPGLPCENIKGIEQLKGVVLIDQSPIGKTARSNVLTYLKIFDAIRSIMASVGEAQARGYNAGTFSLNVDGGRCPVCKGVGHETIDMLFMDDVQITCEACDGKRYRHEILDITYKGKNIDQILNMTVQEAMDFFVAYPNIWRPLSVLKEVGLEYLRLGQSASTFSGGESQRMKLARELITAKQQKTLYIFDEPTTGLHFREVHLLLNVLHKLVEAGGSVLLVEHNLEIIRHSDFVIDMGPEAGDQGGEILCQGTPEELMSNPVSVTGRFLKEYTDKLFSKKDMPRSESDHQNPLA
jgi:excinuclease ABC subunit A